jgi:hypothetical protein
VCYAPGAGGNHLKNLLCTSQEVANHHELDRRYYDKWDPENHAPGEVNCVGGRNIQEIFLDRMHQEPQLCWVMPAHFGELAQHRLSLPDPATVDIIIISIQDPVSRTMLLQRQMRLGQHIHPYWLDEELLHLYQPFMYEKYFGFVASNMLCIELKDFWQRDWVNSQSFLDLKVFFSPMLVDNHCRDLHEKWWDLNFDTAVARDRISALAQC